MSLVEEAIDCAKTDANVKAIPTSPKATLASKEIAIAMDVDVPEKTDNQNGSKDEIEAKSLPQNPKIVADVVDCTVEPVKEPLQTAMDVDIPSNGNNLEEEKDDNETEISEELKTDQVVESKDQMEKKDEVKNNELNEIRENKDQDMVEKEEEFKNNEQKETPESGDHDQIDEDQVKNNASKETMESEDQDQTEIEDPIKNNAQKESMDCEDQDKIKKEDQIINKEIKTEDRDLENYPIKNNELKETVESEDSNQMGKENKVKNNEQKESMEIEDRDQIEKEDQVINKELQETSNGEERDQIENDKIKNNDLKETMESEDRDQIIKENQGINKELKETMKSENRDQKESDVTNNELKETIKNKKTNDQSAIRYAEKGKDEVVSLDQEKAKNQVENRDHENEDQLKSEGVEKTDDENKSAVENPIEDPTENKIQSQNEIESRIEEEIKIDVQLKIGSSEINDDAKNQDQLLDEIITPTNTDDKKIFTDPQNEDQSKNVEQLTSEDHEMADDMSKNVKQLLEQMMEEDEEMTEAIQKEDQAKDVVLSRDDHEMAEPLYIDESCYFQNEKIVELSRCSWTSKSDKQQYLRGCLWSPDGTCILTAVNMDGMHVINLPTDLYSNETVSPDRPLDILQSVIHVKESGTVYDYCWYPFMNSSMPETCCWISSRQHCPIQLWDGFDGELRASYRGYDIVDEVEAAFSVTFTSDAEKIIGGYKKTLKVFDTKVPGRQYTVIPIKQPCSCFAVQATQSDIIATGSWNCSINLYDLRLPKFGSLVTLAEHTGGITFLKFVASGDSLFSGARKDDCLFEWDMRKFSKPIRKLSRNVKTNQRIYFDLSPGEKWLASGDTEGLVHLWDLNEESSTKEYQFSLHHDCCNGVGFHPSRSMLATCSGQFHFLDNDDASKESKIQVYENSLIFWWFGNTTAANDGKDNDDGGAVEPAVQLAT